MSLTYQGDQKTRLDKYLCEQYPKTSRSQIQKAIKNGEILVNGKTTTVHHFLKGGEEIELKIDFDTMRNNDEDAYNAPIQPNKKIKLDIIAETDDYLIVNKPAGMLAHPTDKNETDTLANCLLAYYPEIKNISDCRDEAMPRLYNERPGIVHRIDRDASGLLVVAKTQKMFEHLKNQFKNRTVKKEYIALAHGEFSDSSGTIDFPIGISKQSGKMAARPVETRQCLVSTTKSKTAITTYEVTKQYQDYTLLKIQIKTGRTHQIRVHLNAIGHPVIGDQIYKPKNLHTRVKLGRIFLHAEKLGFEYLDHKWREFESELPEELDSLLGKLS